MLCDRVNVSAFAAWRSRTSCSREPGSALYASTYPEELYDRAREALLAL